MNSTKIHFDIPIPWAVVICIVFPLLVFFALKLRERRRRERLARFASNDALIRLGNSSVNQKWKIFRLVAVMFFCSVAFIGPRMGISDSEQQSHGLDIAIALDASLSMLAEDERPSRLERMKQEVRRLRASSRADRYALLAFAGRSYILTPLTADEGALELYLDNLSPDIVGQAGSSIARAIRQGTDLLSASTSVSDRVLVIMSDGEAFESVPEVRSAAEEAQRQGVILITVGFGSLDGSSIPIISEGNTQEKTDNDGNVVISKYSPELLSEAADAAGGTFIDAGVADRAGQIRAAMSGLRTEKRLLSSREAHISRYAWFLFPALLILLLDICLSLYSPNSFFRSFNRSNAQLMAFVLIILGAACSSDIDPSELVSSGDYDGALKSYRSIVESGDSSSHALYNLGTSFLLADSLMQSLESFESATQQNDVGAEVLARALYNEGLAYLKNAREDTTAAAQESYSSAAIKFREYLKLQSDDIDAKWNYELTLRPQPPSSGGGGGDSEDQEDAQPDEGGGLSSLDLAQAEALLNSAARDERDVQGKRQRVTRQPPPPGARDW